MALPFELVTLILARLPVKSLLRFKSVSKELNSLISTPYFAELQVNHSPRGGHVDDHQLIVIGGDKDSRSQYMNCRQYIECRNIDSHLSLISKFDLLSVLDEKFGRPSYRKQLCCSCNGLIILEYSYYNPYRTELIMWNPLTGNHFILPYDGPQPKCGETYSYGFGYDKSNNDYKLVRLRYGDHYTTQIYSSKRNYWGPPMAVKNTNGLRLPGHSNRTLIDNHIIHWWVYVAEFDGKCYIRGFDISSEEWLDVPCLDLPQGHEFGEVGVLDNCLCIDSFLNNELVDWSSSSIKDETVDIWIMKEYGVKESWIKLFSLPYHGYVDDFTYPERWHSESKDYYKAYWMGPPIGISRGGDEVLMNLLYCLDSYHRWYNLKDKAMRPYRLCENSDCSMFVASLVPVPTNDESTNYSLSMQ